VILDTLTGALEKSKHWQVHMMKNLMRVISLTGAYDEE
jgi:hypothetical protein